GVEHRARDPAARPRLRMERRQGARRQVLHAGQGEGRPGDGRPPRAPRGQARAAAPRTRGALSRGDPGSRPGPPLDLRPYGIASNSAAAVRPLPPKMEEILPLAVLSSPPLTLAYSPLAMF